MIKMIFLQWLNEKLNCANYSLQVLFHYNYSIGIILHGVKPYKCHQTIYVI